MGLKYKKGSWVYVRLEGLYLGNYRMMLSLGGAPSESWNKAGEHKFYANSNLEIQSIIDKHVFAGEMSELKVGSYADWKSNPESVDIITVTPDNYVEVFNADKVNLTAADGSSFEMVQRELMFGRLMRFEGLECHYAGVPNQDGVTNLPMKSGSYDNIYPSWLYTDPRPTVTKAWYQWAFKEEITGRSLYGSVCFMYDREEKMNTCYEEKVDEDGNTVIINKWYCSPTILRQLFVRQTVSIRCVQVATHALHVATCAKMARRQQSLLSTASMRRSQTTRLMPTTGHHISCQSAATPTSSSRMARLHCLPTSRSLSSQPRI